MDLDQLALLAQEAAERADDGSTEAEEALVAAIERAGRYIAHRPGPNDRCATSWVSWTTTSATVDAAVARLIELRLIDDSDYARRWIEERARTKGKAPDVLVSELRARGVTREVAEDALAEVGLDEDTQAIEVAAKLTRKVLRFPLGEQGPRLYELMRRRGFSHEHAEAGARAVLPPEGWD